MKHFITLLNEQSQKRIDIDVTHCSNIEDVFNEIKTLPRDGDGTTVIGNVKIWLWGGGAVDSHETS